MSITLPVVDLSSAVVGTSGTIPLQASGLVSVPSDKPPFLAIFNDSGAGLLISLKKSSQQFYLSAKGHILVAISNAEGEIAYQVMNISTNIQVNQLWAVYFYPGEPVTDFSALGTSSVSQQATTLQNLNNPPGSIIIFSEPVGDASTAGAVNLDNQGHLVLGDNLYNGSIAILGVGGNKQISLSLTGYFREFDSTGALDVDIEPGSITINGSTSGTAQLWQLWRGNFKYIICFLNNFRNGGGSTQTITFPVAFLFAGYCRTTSFPAAQLLSGGVAQTVNVITALAVGGGTPTGATVFGGYSFFDFQHAMDTLSFNSGQATPHTGFLIIEGI